MSDHVPHNLGAGKPVAIPSPAPPAWTPPAGRPARLLLVRLSALGDVLHALPALAALRALLPDACLDWAVEDRTAPLLRDHPDLRRVVAFPRAALSGALRGVPRPLRLARGLRAFAAELRAGRYDAVLDLQGNLKSGLVARLAGAPVVAGAARGREGSHLLLTHPLPPPPDGLHKVERNLRLVGALLGRPAPWSAPRLGLGPEDAAQAEAALSAAGVHEPHPLVLHPGTSGFGAFKRWPPERFAAVARRLASPARPAAITFGPAERELAELVARHSDRAARPVPTPSLRALAALVARARLVVAGDTGPLHLAALLGAPVLGVYGPKDPAVYGPHGLRPDGTPGLLPVALKHDVACRPCTLRRCAAPVCLTTLAPDEALRALPPSA